MEDCSQNEGDLERAVEILTAREALFGHIDPGPWIRRHGTRRAVRSSGQRIPFGPGECCRFLCRARLLDLPIDACRTCQKLQKHAEQSLTIDTKGAHMGLPRQDNQLLVARAKFQKELGHIALRRDPVMLSAQQSTGQVTSSGSTIGRFAHISR